VNANHHGTERDWLNAAATPRAWTTHPGKATREDLFNATDLLTQTLGQRDALLDSAVRMRITEIRSLAATLIPKPERFKCDYIYEHEGRQIVCGIAHGSTDALATHKHYVHGENPGGCD
jgi:hypothetical protein